MPSCRSCSPVPTSTCPCASPTCASTILLDLGRILARIVGDLAEPVGRIIASSDMSHYLPEEEANRLDHLAIEAALTRDPARLYETVHRHGIAMCGVVPATVALAAANDLAVGAPALVAYQTSGATTVAPQSSATRESAFTGDRRGAASRRLPHEGHHSAPVMRL